MGIKSHNKWKALNSVLTLSKYQSFFFSVCLAVLCSGDTNIFVFIYILCIPPFGNHQESEFCSWKEFQNNIILSFRISNEENED